MKSLVFTKNRENLLKKLEDNSLLVLFAGEAKEKQQMNIFHLLQTETFII